MSLTPSFAVTQSAANPSAITLTDTSTGSDGNITSRNIYIQLANGNYLTTNGEVTTQTAIVWPYANISITTPVLPRSEAPRITVDWVNVSNVQLYQATNTFCFDFSDYIFMLGLTLRQVTNNSITQDANWYGNKMQMIVNTNDAENSIVFISDITLAQNALDKNYFMILNKNKYF